MRKKGFFNFRFFDGISDGLLSDRIIRVHDDRIAGVEELSAKDKYSDYEWTDLNGLTLMPGFIDAHIHITVPFVFKVNLAALRSHSFIK
jgi:imidazolonepropionase-like amidohydrolase